MAPVAILRSDAYLEHSMKLFLHEIPSPIGTIFLVTDGKSIRSLDFSDYEDRMHRLVRVRYGDAELTPAPAPAEFRKAFAAYFKGDITALDNLPVDADGTPFQRTVWSALRQIPAGTTISYGELARRVGNPKASRAVGLANGSNPVGIVVPCHRVIGANGALTGYGSGIERKRWLLDHERQANHERQAMSNRAQP
jgi:methylated-DNA-[protein]-cysteine S-methyltransferase